MYPILYRDHDDFKDHIHAVLNEGIDIFEGLMKFLTFSIKTDTID